MAEPVIHFSLIGGPHQFLHIVPVAAALSHHTTSQRAHVRVFTASADDAAAASKMLNNFGAANVEIITLELPSWTKHPARVVGGGKMKRPQLLYWRRQIRDCDMLITAERTSTILKKLPGKQPLYIHIPHGAGDGAKGFEPRLRRFDHIIAAGPKDKRRMVAQKLGSEDSIMVSGYIKLAALQRLQAGNAEPLFHNDRPVILYNPHFNRALSSWDKFGRGLIEAVQADGRYNLIVAPHIRMFEKASETEKAAWTRLADPENCIIDLGSERCIDMHYANAADIYIGDVSSQIYEFQSIPRPCLFLNAHKAEWRDNPDYQMWHMGAVWDTADDVMKAIDGAFMHHADYADIQRAMVQDAFGPVNKTAEDGRDDAIARAADIIMALIPTRQST